MNTRSIGQKLKSTKLWMAIAGISTGIAIAFGADAGTIQTVAGAITAVLSAMTYIITEGKIDTAAVSNAVTKTEEAIGAINKASATTTTITSTDTPANTQTQKTINVVHETTSAPAIALKSITAQSDQSANPTV